MLIKKNHLSVKSKSHIWKTIATALVTHLKPMFPSNRNQSIYLHCKSIDWFF